MAHSFLLGLLALSLVACGGIVDRDGDGIADEDATPPAVNTRFTLRVDDRDVALAPPTGTRFVQPTGGSHIALYAEAAQQGGDHERLVSANLAEPVTTGTFDCTPNAQGYTTTGYSFAPNAFIGFTAKLTECQLTVQYVTSTRIVGRFTVKGHAPEGSSLDGTVATITSEFDVPIEQTIEL